MTDQPPAAGQGHNRPPSPIMSGEELQRYLAGENEKLLGRRDDLLSAAERAPAIVDEDTAQRITDFIRQIHACTKAAEGARVAAKEPYLEAERAVDGFFRKISGPLEKLIDKRTRDSLQARLTIYMQDKADRELKERREQLRLAREEEERKQRIAEEEARAMRNQQELDAAVIRQKQAADAAAARAAAEKAAAAKPADMSRVRGDFGAVGSLKRNWDFRDLNRATLDLEKLREHLPMDGLERAVRSFIKSGGRALQGVEIYEDTNAQVR